MHCIFDGHPDICRLTAGLRFCQGQPEVHPQPVLEPGSPIDALGASYPCVVKDGGRWRMWYQAWLDEWDGQDVLRVALAESDDGITWQRVRCGRVEYKGSVDNALVDLPMHGVNVSIDPSAPPEKRYRGFGYFDPRALQGLPGDHAKAPRQPGFATAYSADGIHWPLEGLEIIWNSYDVINAAPDPTGGWLVFLKRRRHLRGMNRRTFYEAEFANGKLSKPREALWPDELDDLHAIERGYLSSDYYGISLGPRVDGSTQALLWNFRHQPPYPENRVTGVRGQVELSPVMKFSRNGGWHHAPGRKVFLGPEDVPDWGFGCIYGSPVILTSGDEQRLYFAGTCEYHSWQGVDVERKDFFKHITGRGGFAKIGLASWPRDRMTGIAARFREIVSFKNLTTGRPIHLNVAARPGGCVRAAIWQKGESSPLEGFTLEDCRPVTGDHLAAELLWGDRRVPAGEFRPGQLQLEIELTDATLWAWGTKEAETKGQGAPVRQAHGRLACP